jgi:hypothetical protein
MLDFLNTLKDTPIPTILVVAGIVFILLAIAGQLEILKTPPLVSLWQKWLVGTIGGLFLIAGLLIYLRPNLTGGGWVGPLVAVMVILIVLSVALWLVARLLTSKDKAYNDVLKEMESDLDREKKERKSPQSTDTNNRGTILIRADKEMDGHRVKITGLKTQHEWFKNVERRGADPNFTYIATFQYPLSGDYRVETLDLDPNISKDKYVSPWKVAEFDLRRRKSG